ncbi:MAG: hypothetical protein GY906_06055 [bacterium]|nr:hypothetical protein [bacterium]
MNRAQLTTAILLIGMLALSVGNVAIAKKKKLNGQDLFKEYCKPCHDVDSENGEYTPMTLIQDQWERFFDEKYAETHESVTLTGHDGSITDEITPEMLKAIKKFAVDHAADSESPMTCG